ncbi:hypothetical protein GCM10010912_47070 [Paenibacillus albidus]|uniref:DUF4179 domain-containing protein n=1 Tax=Paenibacillus albidus TaxID=2041023 RepID=A0A917CU41_9BACL|nr:DUF4179 domain-containing protein [Paenibacillus albidus]GGF96904.1 hypothetical protein GCM10010912_47070 [Paenibacillus albidus]
MKQWQNRTESQKMDDIRQTLRNQAMPKDSYSSQIMNQIGEMDMERRKKARRRSKIIKKTLVAVSAAAVLGTVVIATGFISPAWADTIRQIPIVGSVFKITEDRGLSTAGDKGLSTAPNQSVTHDGVTLKVTDVYYDGTRLAIAFEREGIDNEQVVGKIIPKPIKFDPSVKEVKGSRSELDQSVKGLLGIPVVKLPSGEEVQSGNTSTGDIEGKRNTMLFDAKKLLNTDALGNEFELSVSVEVAQIAEPFVFKVPVKKVTEGIIRLDLDQTKTKGEFSYTVKKLELTPAASRLIIHSKGAVPYSSEQTGDYSPSAVYYEIVDQDGVAVKGGNHGVIPIAGLQHPIVDESYDPFAVTPTSITVKPYTLTFDKNLKVLEDAKGQMIKTYITELEQTIQIP